MRKWMVLSIGTVLFATAGAVYGAPEDDSAASLASNSTTLPNNYPFSNESGRASSFSTQGDIEKTGAFFEKLGNNDRTCETCHTPSDGWGLSTRTIRDAFRRTGGVDPLFEFDGHNCPEDDLSTVDARRAASSLMLSKALLRFAKALPETREYDIIAADGLKCTTSDLNQLFYVYRKTLAATNFQNVSSVLWDGRGGNGQTGLRQVANGAVFQHSERVGGDIREDQKDHIVNLGNSLSSAQSWDVSAKSLSAQGALGGAVNLSTLPTSGPPGFTIYNAWSSLYGEDATTQARRSIARGQAIFNTRTFAGGQTCTTCHNSQNFGNNLNGAFFATGVASKENRARELPLYTVANRSTGAIVKVTDLGRGIESGKWEDIGKFKPPMLRSLASRPPYFHDGSAATLSDVVSFYNRRFSIGLSYQDGQDLANFLKAL
ncbi:hypothetical protein LVJ94_26480 [Pendulispora rubella]|uniref:Cytochrome c domain-containing protein n=1 Tax=Pendulispora rubella TaxID=2741070 RepID=A0ABZ2KP74_9BACT